MISAVPSSLLTRYASREAPFVTAVETREPRKPSYLGGGEASAESAEVKGEDGDDAKAKERNKSVRRKESM